MTHVARELFDKIAISGCPVCTYDLVTDIILLFGVIYYNRNYIPLQTSRIKYMAAEFNQESQFLTVYIRYDDDIACSTFLTFERLQTYKENENE